MSDDSDKDSSESTVSKNLLILKQNENDEEVLQAMDFLQAKARGNCILSNNKFYSYYININF